MSDRGDRGMTSGECNLTTSKDSTFVEVVGAIDELQARIGLTVVCFNQEKNCLIAERLMDMEKSLREVMGCLYKRAEWTKGDLKLGELIEWIEKSVTDKNGVEENFLLPGKSEIESRINFCRTGCRTAERRLVTLKYKLDREKDFFDSNILKYFNKLSTYFYWIWRKELK